MPRLSSVSCCLTSPTSHLPRCTPDPFFTISKLHHQILGAHGRGLGSFGMFLVFLCFRGHMSWSEHWVKSSHWPAEHQSQVPVPGGSSVSVTMVKNQRLEGGRKVRGCHCPEFEVLSSFLILTLDQHWTRQMLPLQPKNEWGQQPRVQRKSCLDLLPVSQRWPTQ